MSNAGVWAGFVILAYAVIIFYQSLTLDYSTRLGPGPGFFPRWLSGGLIVLSLFYIGESIKHGSVLAQELWPKGKALKTILSMLGGLVIFTVIVESTGFVIAGTILLFSMFIHDYKWYTALGASVIISAALLFVFQSLLGVTLPVNEFGW